MAVAAQKAENGSEVMEPPPPISADSELIWRIRDALLGWMDKHRQGCGDEPRHEPLNLIGYLSHCLGVRAETKNAKAWLEAVAFHEKYCEGCQHLRN